MEKKLISIETVDYLKVNFKKLLESLKKDEILKKAFYDLVEKNESANLPYHGNAHSLSVGLLMYQTFYGASERNKRVASLGIHKEQYSDSSYEEIELGSRDFREKEIAKFMSLEDNCPVPLKGLYNLFKQS